MNKISIKGRGTSLNPGNRFEKMRVEIDPEWLEQEGLPPAPTTYFIDNSISILSKNDSPDIPFTYSLNPYRGCEHGCIYCYARPTHEYLGWSSGLDFETRILVKPRAPALLERELCKPGWRPQVIMLSGNTDCYQIAERRLCLTRGCLEVLLRYRNPVGIITKNALILRDLDLLQELARLDLVAVTLSITTLDNQLCRKMEPRTSAPEKRLAAIARLAAAGIPAGVNFAPVIPGLNDHEMAAVLAAAAERGATHAGYLLLRLPHAVSELFKNWLAVHYPGRAAKVLHALAGMRQGRLNDPCFGSRMTGEGEHAETIARLFAVCCRKYGLNQHALPLSTGHFRRPQAQTDLFGHT
ncbi:MAG: PA0069 family radical SAM protein [candidate division KSB1 bacterium]|nr:PA0069 family radical SAM protein [candidate division KSB1 bacterium]MDZ7275903.1 PA0069 family radical SAM protein [candidate division KSB1 bacterium]MDZ7287653.1 PA0069 family radical SAM protein [candidate division KSB1 bacterium]MDZ7309642.1 PA0069 family radical SAM protein [candidate division KSB1 bacterium]MDZ7350631.1 PA0069 family radical SAM protein [candidate division KSB1 bacterium]